MQSPMAQQMLGFHYPRWAELPAIELYMDQVTGYINEAFALVCPEADGVCITKAMVNNYVKQRIVAPPNKKKYNRDHLAHLMAICVFKQTFSIPEIGLLLQHQLAVCPIEQAHDRLCDELEVALKINFGGQEQPTYADANEPAHLMKLCAQGIANKIYVQKCLEFEQQAQPEAPQPETPEQNA